MARYFIANSYLDVPGQLAVLKQAGVVDAGGLVVGFLLQSEVFS